jgi:hypothetical protein
MGFIPLKSSAETKLTKQNYGFFYAYLCRTMKSYYTCVEVMEWADLEYISRDLGNPDKFFLRKIFVDNCKAYMNWLRFRDTMYNDLFYNGCSDLTKLLPYELRLDIKEKFLHCWYPTFSDIDWNQFYDKQTKRQALIRKSLRKKLIQNALAKRNNQ